MQRYPHRAGRHLQPLGGIHDRNSFDCNGVNHGALAGRQLRQMALDFAAGRGRALLVGRKLLRKLIDRQIEISVPPTKRVHKLVPGDRMNPWLDRKSVV